MKPFRTLPFLALGLVAPAHGASLLDTLRARPEFSEFVRLSEKSGLVATFIGPGPNGQGYTLFVPTNAAFKRVPQIVINELENNVDLLDRVMKYHVSAGATAGARTLTTLEGEKLVFTGARAGGAAVVGSGTNVSGARFYAVDRVLLPPQLRRQLIANGLITESGASAAFITSANDRPSERDPRGAPVRVTNTGVRATAGPGGAAPGAASGASVGEAGGPAVYPGGGRTDVVGAGRTTVIRNGRPTVVIRRAGRGNVYDAIRDDRYATIFGDLVKTAGYDALLAGPGSFTVLMPSDKAFDALPPGTLDGLRANPQRLRQILARHILVGRFSERGTRTGFYRTYGGTRLRVLRQGGTTKFGAAVAGKGQRVYGNGIVRRIDRIIL